MQLIVSGKNFQLRDSFREEVEEKVNKTVTKYFEKAINTRVIFIKENHSFHAEIIVNEGVSNQPLIRVDSESRELQDTLDEALHKIEQRLRKYKKKLNNHHKRAENNTDVLLGIKYTISPFKEEEDELEDSFDGDGVDDHPVIIAERNVPIETMTVSQAVMKMDLLQVPTLMFKNKSSGRINVVYYRKDANISWIDPKGQ